jgi:ABC-type multidrug transport system ATPase subunit
MDEVEALADRIAILNKGEVKCFGSLEFLKNLQDFNQTLKIAIEPSAFNQTQMLDFLAKNTKTFKMEEQAFDRVVVNACIDTNANLNVFLENFNNQKKLFGAIDCKTNPTSIEDIFLRYVFSISFFWSSLTSINIARVTHEDCILTELEPINRIATHSTGIRNWFR